MGFRCLMNGKPSPSIVIEPIGGAVRLPSTLSPVFLFRILYPLFIFINIAKYNLDLSAP